MGAPQVFGFRFSVFGKRLITSGGHNSIEPAENHKKSPVITTENRKQKTENRL
jgi:hypothetical protein